ncbi:MAG: glycosyltransferase, partial [Ignavibacteriaceae bacterium]|nr:glycosyltransferase [Ignavibacteriaceae bacterium]
MDIEFDLAHVHHNINAIEVRNQFPKLPIVYVSHGVLPFLEQPPLVDLGISKYIAVSEEVYNNLVEKGVNPRLISIIRNPIDEKKFFPEKHINETPKNGLVVSNKISDEKLEIIQKTCRLLDIDLRIVGGRNGETNQDTLREMIQESDIIFSIGRGVIEAIFSGRAAVVFDYEGGDGMVTPDNILKLMEFNFSGRMSKTQFNVQGLTDEVKKYDRNSINQVRSIALKYFSSEVIFEKLITEYWNCIKSSDTDISIDNSLIKFISSTIREVNYYTSISTARSPKDNGLTGNSRFLKSAEILPPTSNKKLKIGFLANDFSSACPMIRVISVLHSLQKMLLIDFIPLFNLQKLRKNNSVDSITEILDLDALRKLDVLIVQREFCITVPFNKLKELLDDTSVKIVFEIDDNLLNLYPEHVLFKTYEANRKYFHDYLANSDLVTVTTKELKNAFSGIASRIAVLPNYIDDEIWGNKFPKRVANRKVRILFSGSKTHLEDLALIEDVIVALSQEYQDKVEFVFWGNITSKIEINCHIKKITDFMPSYATYAKRLSELDIDIGLIPLADNEFNRSKSNIKYLDYSAAGITSIMSKVNAYNEIVTNGVNGVLAENNFDSWYSAIKLLLDDSIKRNAIAQNAHSLVLSSYTTQTNAFKWLQIYSSLLNLNEKKKMPKTSIIVLTYNSLKYTKKFYQSLVNSNVEEYELIIIDNASTDSTKEFLDEISKHKPKVKVIFNETNVGFPCGINQALKEAKGNYIVIANNDIVLTEGWLERMIEVA